MEKECRKGRHEHLGSPALGDCLWLRRAGRPQKQAAAGQGVATRGRECASRTAWTLAWGRCWIPSNARDLEALFHVWPKAPRLNCIPRAHPALISLDQGLVQNRSPFEDRELEASFSREGPGVSPHLPHVPVRPSLGGASGIVPLGFGLGPEGMKARQESHPQPFPISRIWKVLPLWAPDQRAWGSFGTRSYCQVSLPSCLYHGLLHRTWFLP